VVNNNAAAVLVVLAALCEGREVIISRGELIEIGGEFRIPDVMELSGARLVEVGTTNRTHLGDYERAISPETAAILKVHPSNYRMVGFTADVATRDLARVARERGLHLINDVGSGLIEEPEGAGWVGAEPIVPGAIEDGADIVTFSGDKLLGGPQAGVIVGGAALIDRIATHPLMRAIRIDKMTLAALEATLHLYATGRMDELPLWKLANAPLDELEERARKIAVALSDGLAPGWKVDAQPSIAVAGGGTTPGTTLSSWAVALGHAELIADEIAAALRRATPPVIGRIEDDLVLVDLRSVHPDHDASLNTALMRALD
jgi:L-seryl-tRNA(Ser) seleniumtransferase